MTAQEIVERLAPRGIRFLIEDGRLIVEPASKLSAADRLAIREAKADLLRLLAPDPERTLPIDLGRIADAIARQPRSPFLNDLAIATIAKAALSAEAAMYGLPPAAHTVALLHCRELQDRIAVAIEHRDYQSAYEIAARLDRLPREITELLPQ